QDRSVRGAQGTVNGITNAVPRLFRRLLLPRLVARFFGLRALFADFLALAGFPADFFATFCLALGLTDRLVAGFVFFCFTATLMGSGLVSFSSTSPSLQP